MHYEKKIVNSARQAAEILQNLQKRYKPKNLQRKHEMAEINNLELSRSLANAYNRPELAGLSLPFIENDQLAAMILLKQ